MTDTDNSGRLSDVMEGVRDGGVKEIILSTTDPIAEVIRNALIEKFGDDNPLIVTLANTGSQFVVLLMFAEFLGLLGSQLDGLIDEADEKSQLLARYIRRLAGKEVGQEGVKLIIESLPSIKTLFDAIKTEDIKHALGEHTVSRTEPIPKEFAELEKELNEEVLQKQSDAQASVKRPIGQKRE